MKQKITRTKVAILPQKTAKQPQKIEGKIIKH